MKHRAIAAVLFPLLAASAWVAAQSQTPPAAAAGPAAAPPQAKAAPAPRAERPTTYADARVCLEFPTTTQIIACAERYRWRKSGT
jgi:hypothetical protein